MSLIKVLVVDDSPVTREFLVHILSSDPSIEVIGTANDGQHALEAVDRKRPDVITMDIHMPKVDGLEATRRIMETNPTPIVIVSGNVDPEEKAVTFRAVEAGALALLRRPAGPGHPDHAATARELLQTVKLMSEVRVVRRWSRSRREEPQSLVPLPAIRTAQAPVRVVALGASTGGPPVLQTILSRLPVHFPAPILIVQHMAAGFFEGFVEWLAQSSGLPVHLARQHETILSGHAYVAPEGFQMKVGPTERIVLTGDEPESPHRPSVSYLFRSVADVYGAHAVAGLLTGMGRDGAEELKALRNKGATTFAQDEASCAVFGMPGQAVRIDAATYVFPPEDMAAALVRIANGSQVKGQ